MDDHTGADHRLEVDGIPLDDLLPPPPSRSKRKEPNTILEADTILKTGMATALTATNKGTLDQTFFGRFHNSFPLVFVLTSCLSF